MLAACTAQPTTRAPLAQTPPQQRTDLVFPSAELLQLASVGGEQSGLVGPESSRNDGRLGVASTAAAPTMYFERSVHDRQLVLNGVPQPQYRQTLRSREQVVP